MEKDDTPGFIKIFAKLGEIYDKPISESLVDTYWKVLKDFEFEDVRIAFRAHIYNPDCGQFFPKPADIVRFIEGNGETRALKAWTIVEKAMRQIGVYQSLVFDDCLIHAAIEEMGGWVQLCSMTLDDLPFRAREFQKRYMAFVIKKPTRYPGVLYGLSNIQNTKDGYALELPLFIGNVSVAEQVMLKGGSTVLNVTPLKSIQSALTNTIKQLEEKPDENV